MKLVFSSVLESDFAERVGYFSEHAGDKVSIRFEDAVCQIIELLETTSFFFAYASKGWICRACCKPVNRRLACQPWLLNRSEGWSQLSGSNRRPTVYKTVTPVIFGPLFTGFSLLFILFLTPALPPC